MSQSPKPKTAKSSAKNEVKKRKRSSSLTLPNKIQKTEHQTMDVTVSKEQGTGELIPPGILEMPLSHGQSALQNVNKRRLLFSPPAESGKTLDSLLMKTGPLADLLKGEDDTWTNIASNLKDVFLPIQQDPETEDPDNYVAGLCTIYYEHEKDDLVIPLPDGQHLNEEQKPNQDGQKPDQVNATADFLKKFMTANGQLGYIKQQDWFTNGDHVIGIDVNYYPDRSGYTAAPAFHKDSGGNNLFVNLIFDNENPIEATEWFADVDEPSTKRTSWQGKLLPDSHLKELERSRNALREQLGENSGNVSGGISAGKHTYVSWVDDLVWHSTPSTSRRLIYTLKDAERAYKSLNLASRLPDDIYDGDEQANQHTFPSEYFVYYDGQLERNIKGTEILGTIAESQDTHLHRWLERQKLKAQDIDLDLALKAWGTLYRGKTGEGRYREDVAKRAESPWRIAGGTSEANAKDERLLDKGSVSIRETPIGLSKRRRANSLTENRAAIKEARVANEGETRSFLRTWVRILSKDDADAEIKEATDETMGDNVDQ